VLVIASFLKRPCAPSRNDFFAVYVLLSRIRQGSDFRAIAKAVDLEFLNRLHPPAHLTAFMYGYDQEGHWNYMTAKNKLIELEMKSQSHPRKRK
jgi:hypothetical protein